MSMYCVVCLGSYEEGDVFVATACGHIFHESCLNPWVESKQNCPTCKREVLYTIRLFVGGGPEAAAPAAAAATATPRRRGGTVKPECTCGGGGGGGGVDEETLRMQIQLLRGKLLDSETARIALKSANEGIAGELAALNGELAGIKKTNKGLKLDLKTAVGFEEKYHKINREKQTLVSKLADANTALKKTKDTLDSVESRLRQIQGTMSISNAKGAELSDQVEALAAESPADCIKALLTVIRNNQKAMKVMEDTNTDLTAKVHRLTQKLKRATKSYEESEKARSEAQLKLNSLRRRGSRTQPARASVSGGDSSDGGAAARRGYGADSYVAGGFGPSSFNDGGGGKGGLSYRVVDASSSRGVASYSVASAVSLRGTGEPKRTPLEESGLADVLGSNKPRKKSMSSVVPRRQSGGDSKGSALKSKYSLATATTTTTTTSSASSTTAGDGGFKRASEFSSPDSRDGELPLAKQPRPKIKVANKKRVSYGKPGRSMWDTDAEWASSDSEPDVIKGNGFNIKTGATSTSSSTPTSTNGALSRQRDWNSHLEEAIDVDANNGYNSVGQKKKRPFGGDVNGRSLLDSSRLAKKPRRGTGVLGKRPAKQSTLLGMFGKS